MEKSQEEEILKILSESDVLHKEHHIRALLKNTLNKQQFNSLQCKINAQHYNFIGLLQDWFPMWRSYQAKKATVENLAKILNDMGLKDDAGRQKIFIYINHLIVTCKQRQFKKNLIFHTITL